MYMDDIKLFGKNEIELETLIEAVRTYIQDIGMEFGIEKWAMLIMRCGETTNDGRNRTTKSRKNRMLGEKETYKYLEILEADTIKQVEMREKIKKSIARERGN